MIVSMSAGESSSAPSRAASGLAPRTVSQQPRAPQLQSARGSPKGRWPTSMARPVAPSTGAPSRTRPPPTPVSTVRCRAERAPCEAPRRDSARASHVASLATRRAAFGAPRGARLTRSQSRTEDWTTLPSRTVAATATDTTRTLPARARASAATARRMGASTSAGLRPRWRAETAVVRRPSRPALAIRQSVAVISTAMTSGPRGCAARTEVGRPRPWGTGSPSVRMAVRRILVTRSVAVPVEIPSSRATPARVMPGVARTRAQTSAARAQRS